VGSGVGEVEGLWTDCGRASMWRLSITQINKAIHNRDHTIPWIYEKTIRTMVAKACALSPCWPLLGRYKTTADLPSTFRSPGLDFRSF
jgi:hypothetical protein